MTNLISRSDFEVVELRVGTILSVEAFPQMKKPSYKLQIDLGNELGIKNSSSQLVDHYNSDNLIGKQVLCVCNFPPKQMPGGFVSEVLTTGIIQSNTSVILVCPDQKVENGLRLL
ncbi:MAG: hypothetical protein RL023_780 [Candidatus Parcubacteria bacterium]|jgi:tRNA-binding protein